MRSRTGILLAFPVLVTVSLSGTVVRAQEAGPPLPGTGPLTMTGDIARTLVDGVDRFLLGQIAESTAKRAGHGSRDAASAEAEPEPPGATSSACATRACRSTAPELVGTTARPALVATGDELRSLRGPLAGVRRRPRRGAAARADRASTVGRRRRDPRRRPDARAARRAGRRACRRSRSSPGGWPRAAAA